MALVAVVAGCSARSPAATEDRARDLTARVDAIGRAALPELAGLTIAVSRPHEPVIVRAFGEADRERHIPVRPGTPFRIASASKQFVAYAFADLAERGSLTLDDDVARYLPDFPLQGHRVTLRHLLTHTSGIAEHVGDPATDQAMAAYAGRVFPLAANIALFSARPFDFQPGARWSYSGSGYVLLVAILEQIGRGPYADYLREHVFDPLGLAHTRDCDVAPPPPGLAQGYAREHDRFVKLPPHGRGTMAGGGFVCSTASDLVAWQRALHRSPAGARMSVATPLADGTTVPYGLAVSLGDLDGHRVLSHGGADPGWRASISDYPDDDVVVIVLANTGSNVAFDVAHRVGRAALGLPEPATAALPVDDALLRSVVGTYEIAQGWRWTFVAEAGGITARSDGDPPLRLAYRGEGVFVAPAHEAFRFAFTLEPAPARTLLVDQFGMRFRALRVR